MCVYVVAFRVNTPSIMLLLTVDRTKHTLLIEQLWHMEILVVEIVNSLRDVCQQILRNVLLHQRSVRTTLLLECVFWLPLYAEHFFWALSFLPL